jgi:putative transposase
VRGVWLYLYLVVDVWSRKVVAWDVAEVESAQIAADMVQRAFLKVRHHRPRGFDSRQCHQPGGAAAMLVPVLSGLLPSVGQPRCQC